MICIIILHKLRKDEPLKLRKQIKK